MTCYFDFQSDCIGIISQFVLFYTKHIYSITGIALRPKACLYQTYYLKKYVYFEFLYFKKNKDFQYFPIVFYLFINFYYPLLGSSGPVPSLFEIIPTWGRIGQNICFFKIAKVTFSLVAIEFCFGILYYCCIGTMYR